VELMVNKEHLTKEGLVKIVNIKASMNFGTVSETIRGLFPTIERVERPVVTNLKIYNPH